MKRIGLTGGVGMGKTTSAAYLEELGCLVADTDLLARAVVAPGEPALAEVVRAFGREMLKADGSLDRARLARIVFADPARRRVLENILHPPIRERWQAQLDRWSRENRARAVVVIPLLFETGAEQAFDVILCTACSGPTQRERLRLRGWPGEEVERRIAAQMDTDEKMRRSDHVIWTEGNLELHRLQVRRLLEMLG